jgi:hypothetical protein
MDGLDPAIHLSSFSSKKMDHRVISERRAAVL